jgi:hypothetical protein
MGPPGKAQARKIFLDFFAFLSFCGARVLELGGFGGFGDFSGLYIKRVYATMPTVILLQ